MAKKWNGEVRIVRKMAKRLAARGWTVFSVWAGGEETRIPNGDIERAIEEAQDVEDSWMQFGKGTSLRGVRLVFQGEFYCSDPIEVIADYDYAEGKDGAKADEFGTIMDELSDELIAKSRARG